MQEQHNTLHSDTEDLTKQQTYILMKQCQQQDELPAD